MAARCRGVCKVDAYWWAFMVALYQLAHLQNTGCFIPLFCTISFMDG